MNLIKFSHRNRRLNLRIQYKLVILQTRHQCRLMFEARVDGKVLIGRSTCRIPLRDSHLEEVAVFLRLAVSIGSMLMVLEKWKL